jgi:hypothetical protein
MTDYVPIPSTALPRGRIFSGVQRVLTTTFYRMCWVYCKVSNLQNDRGGDLKIGKYVSLASEKIHASGGRVCPTSKSNVLGKSMDFGLADSLTFACDSESK